MTFANEDTPRNVEAEENFLSICMKDNDAWFSEPVDPSWFFDSKNSAIAFAISKLSKDGRPFDAAHVIEVCLSYSSKGKDVLRTAGGEAYIRHLQQKVVDKRFAKDMLRMVRESSCSRELYNVADKIKSIACSGESDAFTKVASSLNAVAGVKTTPTSDSFMDIADRYARIIEERAETKSSGGLLTGFQEIDWHTKGLRRGSYNIIGALSSAGKTAFSLQMAWQMAVAGYFGYYASIEMNEEAVMDRLTSLVSRVPMDAIVGGHGLKYHMPAVMDAIKRIQCTIGTGMVIDFADSMTPSEYRSKAEQARITLGGLDFCMADYLQFMHHEKKFSGRPELVQNLSFEMKSISKSLNVANIVLAQLSREAATADEPEMWHIAESTQVWRDADTCFLMHTEQLRSDGNRNVAINLKKARNGALGRFKMKFVPSAQRFEPFDGVSEPGSGKNVRQSSEAISAIVDESISKIEWDKL